MRVLGLESSCDETACAVVEAVAAADEGAVPRLIVRADVVASQTAIHARWGGVVPEVAARQHVQNVIPVIEEALAQADLTLDDIDAVAVTRGPGLIGALLVAVQAGKAIAFARGLPIVGVHHLEGHLLAAYLSSAGAANAAAAPVAAAAGSAAAPPLPDVEHRPPPLPHLGLLVSGGHTSLVRVQDFGRYEVLGTTQDDAAGEAFDKVGKLLGLGYPAGPIIDQLAAGGNERAVAFPRAMRGTKRGLLMSFSGLKTAAAARLQQHGPPSTKAELADLCASFQAAVVEQLVRKTELALEQSGLKAVVLSGGVACNRGLRAAMRTLCNKRQIEFFAAPPRWCTDNAAMIACAGYHRLRRGEQADLTLNAAASLPL